MKERPILFSAPMVRAILEGRKTQTRRVVKPQPYWIEWKRKRVYEGAFLDIDKGGRLLINNLENALASFPMGEEKPRIIKCPYGKPGDRLWVREAWSPLLAPDITPLPKTSLGQWKGMAVQDVLYRADGEITLSKGESWHPSIHMPRWASRILLEITNIRVERVQEISEDDIWAEGIDGAQPLKVFSALWDSINGKKHPWSDNPWVWVIEFNLSQNTPVMEG